MNLARLWLEDQNLPSSHFIFELSHLWQAFRALRILQDFEVFKVQGTGVTKKTATRDHPADRENHPNLYAFLC